MPKQVRRDMTFVTLVRAQLIIVAITVTVSSVALSQQRAERTIDEIKIEAVHRAEVGQYPLIGLDPSDVKEAFASIHTKDKDEWAAAFMAVADRYMNEAKLLEKTDPTKANADYIRAWRLGKEIIGYLRLPKNANGPVPLVLAVNGLDSRKEDLAESFSAILPFGVGYLAVDGPGTGQNPIKVSESAERVLSRVLDYIATRPEIDKNRVAMHGVSWGAYWATKMAIVERARLKGASAQSPPTDTFFQKEFLMNSLIGNREYLFDQVPALMAIFDNVKTVDEMTEVLPKMSLVKQGLLGKPMAPMLILAGVKDTQVPISDIYLLLDKGDVPKTAWINPQGGHLGRQVGVWPDPVIFKQVIIPWLVRTLEPESAVKAK